MSDFRLEKLFKFNWQFGLALILLFGIPRFFIVLQANATGNYNFTSLIFLIMWITPFVLLTKQGRRTMGMKKPKNYIWLIYSFFFGIIICTLVYLIGSWLYQSSIDNWFVYISNSYSSIPTDALEGSNRNSYFIIFAVIGMTFSPIGEELLYRGLIHQSLVSRFGNNKASIIDSLAFAITHLAHFGIIYSNNTWKFILIPALLWVIIIYFTGRLFHFCKAKTNSIYGAVICHAGFNLTMIYFIFYHIF